MKVSAVGLSQTFLIFFLREGKDVHASLTIQIKTPNQMQQSIIKFIA
jgi:hypothetical protein